MADNDSEPQELVNHGSPNNYHNDKGLENAIGKEIAKTSHGNSKTTSWKSANTSLAEIDDNYSKKRLKDFMTIYQWDRVDPANTNEVADRVNQYFNYCISKGIKPSISSLAIALHITTATLNHWLKDGAKYNPDLKPLMEEATQIMEAMWEDYMMNGKINPVAGIFIGKNRYGMKDSTDIKISSTNSLDEITNTDEVANKYLKEQSQIIDNDEEEEEEE